MKAKRKPILVAAMILVLISCSGSDAPTPVSPTTPAVLRGTVTDAVGDASTAGPGPVQPDLASATLEVAEGTLTITVTYAPGGWSQARSVWFVLLDLDENSATGYGEVPTGPGTSETFGWEYQITAVDPAETSTGRITRALGPTSFTTAGTVPVTLPGEDAVRVTIPLSSLNNDDGRLRFRVIAAEWDLGGAQPTARASDFMPEAGQAAGTVR
jgi:hypothetical protein